MSLNGGERLRTRYGVTYHPVGEDGIQISNLGGQRTTLVRHKRTIETILERFDETRSQEEVLAALGGEGISEIEAAGAIEFLRGRGFIGTPDVAEPRDPLFHLIRAVHPRASDPDEDLSARLDDLRLTIVGQGAVATAAAGAAANLGAEAIVIDTIDLLCSDAHGEKNGLLVVCADYDDFDRFRTVNAAAVRTGVRSYYARLSGSQLVLGPYVVPHQRPCFGCYADRIEANAAFIKEFKVRTASKELRGRALTIDDQSLVMAGMRYHLGTNLAWHLLGRMNVSRQSEVHHVELTTGEIEKACLLRAPRCEACGAGRDSDPRWAARDLL